MAADPHKLKKINVNDDSRTSTAYATWICKCGAKDTVTFAGESRALRGEMAARKAELEFSAHVAES